jgi:hypothetical protein
MILTYFDFWDSLASEMFILLLTSCDVVEIGLSNDMSSYCDNLESSSWESEMSILLRTSCDVVEIGLSNDMPSYCDNLESSSWESFANARSIAADGLVDGPDSSLNDDSSLF